MGTKPPFCERLFGLCTCTFRLVTLALLYSKVCQTPPTKRVDQVARNAAMCGVEKELLTLEGDQEDFGTVAGEQSGGGIRGITEC